MTTWKCFNSLSWIHRPLTKTWNEETSLVQCHLSNTDLTWTWMGYNRRTITSDTTYMSMLGWTVQIGSLNTRQMYSKESNPGLTQVFRSIKHLIFQQLSRTKERLKRNVVCLKAAISVPSSKAANHKSKWVRLEVLKSSLTTTLSTWTTKPSKRWDISIHPNSGNQINKSKWWVELFSL